MGGIQQARVVIVDTQLGQVDMHFTIEECVHTACNSSNAPKTADKSGNRPRASATLHACRQAQLQRESFCPHAVQLPSLDLRFDRPGIFILHQGKQRCGQPRIQMRRIGQGANVPICPSESSTLPISAIFIFSASGLSARCRHGFCKNVHKQPSCSHKAGSRTFKQTTSKCAC